MEEIRDIVETIQRGCATAGTEVTDVLAAFIARTSVEKNQEVFALDAPLSPDTKREIILMSIEKLLERDNPSLEVSFPVIIQPIPSYADLIFPLIFTHYRQ